MDTGPKYSVLFNLKACKHVLLYILNKSMNLNICTGALNGCLGCNILAGKVKKKKKRKTSKASLLVVSTSLT